MRPLPLNPAPGPEYIHKYPVELWELLEVTPSRRHPIISIVPIIPIGSYVCAIHHRQPLHGLALVSTPPDVARSRPESTTGEPCTSQAAAVQPPDRVAAPPESTTSELCTSQAVKGEHVAAGSCSTSAGTSEPPARNTYISTPWNYGNYWKSHHPGDIQ